MTVKKEIKLLKELLDLCEMASEEMYESKDTKPILDGCDNLIDEIDKYLNKV